MNENSKDRKIDEKKILINMSQCYRNINFYVYSLLNLFSFGQDNHKENYMDYKYRFKPVVIMLANNQIQERKSSSSSINNNYSIESYSEKAKKYFKNIYQCIYYMWQELSKLNLIINNPALLSKNINNTKDPESSNWGQQVISKVNLLSLLFYNMVIYNQDDILRDYLNGEVKNVPRNYFSLLLPYNNKQNANQNIKQISKKPQILEEEIIKIIKDNFTKINSIYFHISEEKITLNVENYPFKVILEISNILRDFKNFKKYKVLVFGFYENQKSCFKDTSNYFLFEKIRSLFVTKLKFIYPSVCERIARENLQNKGELILVQTIIEFVKYIYDYDKIFNTKCMICNKYIRYSLTEKCFFPPYYKVVDYEKEKNQLINKQKTNNNNSIHEKYNYYHFVHEECIMRLAVPAL